MAAAGALASTSGREGEAGGVGQMPPTAVGSRIKQLAGLGVDEGNRGTTRAVLLTAAVEKIAKLGDTWHEWKAGDWWRPGDRSTSSYPDKRMNPREEGEENDEKRTARVGQLNNNGNNGMNKSSGKWKIVAFASHNYMSVTLAWYARLTDLGYTEHVVAAMDEGIFNALTAAGVRVEDHVRSPSEPREPGEPVPGWGRHLWKLWRYRLAYVMRQTQMGTNVFLVDVDTIWQRYVALETLFDQSEDADVDVFFSQGTWYPRDVYDSWGFVGCMGTVAFRATQRTGELLHAALKHCAPHQCDDQVAMNHALLHEFHVRWDRDTGVGTGNHWVKTVAARGANVEVGVGAGAGAGAGDTGQQLKVRMWPKPFVFRSGMKDVKKLGGPGVTGEDLGLLGGPGGTCLGQITPSVSRGDDGGLAEDRERNFLEPFIVAPKINKDGDSKMVVWEKFNRFCFVIDNEKFHTTRLPSNAPQDKDY